MSYPDIFATSSVGALITSNVSINESKEAPLYVSGSIINGSPTLWQEPMSYPEFQTTYRLPLHTPGNIVMDNSVDFAAQPRSFANHRGYGNLVNAHLTPEGSIKATVSPWNRIYPLSKPCASPLSSDGTTKMAWKP
jgi:hypothetical protein